MRTKALLSVAAIAASAISAMAQSNVYSLNIVGYATVTALPGYNLMANPLSAGVTNGANEIGLQIEGAQILTWNGSGFNSVSYVQAFGGWVDDQLNPAAPPSLPPGKGFFFKSTASTNVPITFVGQVVPGPASSNNLALVQGYSIIGSPLPVNGTDITASPINFPKHDGNTILTWDNSKSSYVSALYNPAFNPAPGSGWVDVGLNPIAAPSYSIGQGFFYQNLGAAATWTQSLP